ncbi:MAG: GNAT family N-acetyltransferase [Chloroflexaceae bacterium]|jgi:predicted acetyltransferase|nr:GNAT family N-acetyltransferase [Chloroflexaceae bacterium]
MDYRSLTEADIDAFLHLDAQAFDVSPDRGKVTPEFLAQLRGLFVDGQHVAQLQLFPLQLMTGVGNKAIACGGIGSVAVPPQHRRRGYTAALLRHVCAEMQGSGTPLCLLFPFKASFYHRYGWAAALERRTYRGSPALFAHFPKLPGSFVEVGRESIAELNQIYMGAMRGRFGPLLRDEAWWQTEVLAGWNKNDRYYAFIWRDTGGRGRAYTIYRFGPGDQAQRQLLCREMVALDPEARSQLFAFLSDHDSQCAEVVFRAPADAPVNLLMADPLGCTIEPYGMLRLVDVAGALASFPPPVELSGRCTIAITDDWLAHNQATFALELADGHIHVQRLAEGSPAELRCDVRVLAQLYTRLLRPRTAAAFGLLHVENRPALALLDRLFTGLAPFHSDYF